MFFEQFDTPAALEELEEEDWEMLKIYIDAIDPIVKASRLLGGEKYPTASSVIPFLDEVCPAPSLFALAPFFYWLAHYFLLSPVLLSDIL